MLAVPVAAVAIWFVAAARRRLRPGLHPEPETDARSALTGAVAVGLAYAALCVPLAMVQHLAHLVLGPTGHDHGAGAPATAGVAGLVGYGVIQALQSQAAILVLALGAAAAVRARPRRIWRRRHPADAAPRRSGGPRGRGGGGLADRRRRGRQPGERRR